MLVTGAAQMRQEAMPMIMPVSNQMSGCSQGQSFGLLVHGVVPVCVPLLSQTETGCWWVGEPRLSQPEDSKSVTSQARQQPGER